MAAPRRFLLRLIRRPLALLASLLLIAIAAVVIAAPSLTPYSPTKIDIAHKLSPPDDAHVLGTDNFGRDLLSRIAFGGRSTLLIGVLVVALAFAAGVPIGVVSGTLGGTVDALLMRVVDAWLSFPGLVMAILLAAILGAGLQNAMFAVALTYIPQFARMARGQALAVRAQPFIEASQALGMSLPRLMVRHIFPNSLTPLLVQASLLIGSAILQTASLGFLGLGAQPPLPEWGADVASNTEFLREAAWVAIYPGLAILLTVLGFNLLGDAIVDWLDPRRD